MTTHHCQSSQTIGQLQEHAQTISKQVEKLDRVVEVRTASLNKLNLKVAVFAKQQTQTHDHIDEILTQLVDQLDQSSKSLISLSEKIRDCERSIETLRKSHNAVNSDMGVAKKDIQKLRWWRLKFTIGLSIIVGVVIALSKYRDLIFKLIP